MTRREFLTKVAAMEDVELSEFAQNELEKMDTANEKRKEKVSKKAEENQPLIDHIVSEILTAEPMLTCDVAAAMELTTPKTSALCRAAVAQGKAIQHDVKVKGKGTQKAYSLV